MVFLLRHVSRGSCNIICGRTLLARGFCIVQYWKQWEERFLNKKKSLEKGWNFHINGHYCVPQVELGGVGFMYGHFGFWTILQVKVLTEVVFMELIVQYYGISQSTFNLTKGFDAVCMYSFYTFSNFYSMSINFCWRECMLRKSIIQVPTLNSVLCTLLPAANLYSSKQASTMLLWLYMLWISKAQNELNIFYIETLYAKLKYLIIMVEVGTNTSTFKSNLFFNLLSCIQAVYLLES